MAWECTTDLLFDWFGISDMTTDHFCFYLQNRLIQTSQAGGQRYSNTSPFSIPWLEHLLLASLSSLAYFFRQGQEPILEWITQKVFKLGGQWYSETSPLVFPAMAFPLPTSTYLNWITFCPGRILPSPTCEPRPPSPSGCRTLNSTRRVSADSESE